VEESEEEEVCGEGGGEADVDSVHMGQLRYSWLCLVAVRAVEARSSSVLLTLHIPWYNFIPSCRHDGGATRFGHQMGL
jgi:hypothetical protein